MATIHQIRGALLEEIVLHLLVQAGYRIVEIGEEGTRPGPAGLEVEGRGCWHQIDAFASPLYSPPFMYPLRLVLEAKCYAKNPVDIRVVRAAAGTVMDISQNYFTREIRGSKVQMQRYNYAAAIFSASGYAAPAQQFAAAHQIFLIDYRDVPAMRPVIKALFSLGPADFGAPGGPNIRVNLAELRAALRTNLSPDGELVGFPPGLNEGEGAPAWKQITSSANAVGGSYYGMIEGTYPVHLLSENPLSIDLLQHGPDIPCRIHVSQDGRTWEFEPSQILEGADEYFRLQFQLPTVIAEILHSRREQEREWMALVGIKLEYLSFIDIVGRIADRFAALRLTLDQDWLDQYVTRRQALEDKPNEKGDESDEKEE